MVCVVLDQLLEAPPPEVVPTNFWCLDQLLVSYLTNFWRQAKQALCSGCSRLLNSFVLGGPCVALVPKYLEGGGGSRVLLGWPCPPNALMRSARATRDPYVATCGGQCRAGGHSRREQIASSETPEVALAAAIQRDFSPVVSRRV